ncbi:MULTISPECIES: lipoprotein [Micromonospora]|uniref:DUF3558 domain-containing protein n=1 Tax=Micromonospora yangpuensis TaxID=683228 RepID=A0A1C6V2R6_9ACTN|nr:lipoprotein [Micromonospora yangpuensis]GGL98341.1 hypothetical protein GCM10012279_14760 [Micromonospora yangpuensis]SCL60414.1 hypothetical protein GA0070617_4371 [Micromonospora yangpuensis]
MHRRVAVLAALTLTVITGCAGGEDGPVGSVAPSASGQVAAGPPWHDEIAPAAAGGTVGGPGSGCELPVTFDVVKGRTAKPVSEDGLGQELAKITGATPRCEIDGRPDSAGFLRVWTAAQPTVEPRPALEAYLAGAGQLSSKVTDAQYRTVRAGTFDAVEVSWIATSENLDEKQREWALAVRAGEQTVLLTANESILAEIEDVVPGYRLAARTLAPIT